MSRYFGSATTDMLVKKGIRDLGPGGTAFSFGCWFKQDAQAGGGLSDRIFFTMNNAAATAQQLFCSTGTDELAWQSTGSGGNGQLVTTDAPLTPYQTWRCIVATNDATLTVSGWSILMGTAATAMAARTTTPTNGSVANNAGIEIHLGNAFVGFDRNLHGHIAQAFVVPWVMTLADAERFRKGDWTVLYRRGNPIMFLPMIAGNLKDALVPSGGWVRTGTTMGADPPVRSWSFMRERPL